MFYITVSFHVLSNIPFTWYCYYELGFGVQHHLICNKIILFTTWFLFNDIWEILFTNSLLRDMVNSTESVSGCSPFIWKLLKMGKFVVLFTIYIFFRGEHKHSPPNHRLCSRVPHIWRNHRGQHIWSVMGEPRPGKNTFAIMVSPLSGNVYCILIPM